LKPENARGAQKAQAKVADAPWGLQSPPLVMMIRMITGLMLPTAVDISVYKTHEHETKRIYI
jgi:hypothetical protein